jgi:hypothetical protein
VASTSSTAPASASAADSTSPAVHDVAGALSARPLATSSRKTSSTTTSVAASAGPRDRTRGARGCEA